MRYILYRKEMHVNTAYYEIKFNNRLLIKIKVNNQNIWIIDAIFTYTVRYLLLLKKIE